MLKTTLALKRHCACALAACAFLFLVAGSVHAQHESDVLGVKIGMDIPTALETVFRNSGRPAGKERPDGKKMEGKDKKDVRVFYQDLKEGTLQIVFAEGKRVKEIIMEYKKPLLSDDLRLLETTSTYGNNSGDTQRDDRYAVGFTSEQKRERYWWRDEKTPEGYRVRIGFISANLTKGGMSSKEIARKIIVIHPEDATKFAKTVAAE